MLKLIKSLFTKKVNKVYVLPLIGMMNNDGFSEAQIVQYFANIDNNFYRNNKQQFFKNITDAINYLLETNYIDYDFDKAIYYQIP